MTAAREFADDERAQIARAVMRAMDAWGVAPEQQVLLLGFDDMRPRKLHRYRAGEPFPQDEALLLRAHYLLTIHNAVESMYPHSTQTGHLWVTTPNPLFSEKTPLEIMLEHGVEGMRRLVSHLNGTSDWWS